jgi:hypothetical protein
MVERLRRSEAPCGSFFSALAFDACGLSDRSLAISDVLSSKESLSRGRETARKQGECCRRRRRKLGRERKQRKKKKKNDAPSSVVLPL